METLAARGLVVAVTGESVSKMMKFTHQIITECAYNLMLDSQRRKIHKAIVEEYENSSIKYEMDVLAHHWLRSGEVDRGCDMLQNAAIKALDIGAFKECVNSLSQAIAYGKQVGKERIAYWTALLGYAKFSFGDRYAADYMMLQACKILDDETFSPQKRTQGSIDKMIRKYGEFDDIPSEVVDGNISYADQARTLIAFTLGGQSLYRAYTIQGMVMEDYKLNEDDIHMNADWFRYYSLIASYNQKNVELWYHNHSAWGQAGFGRIAQTDPGQARRIYRRLTILSSCEQLKPQLRAEAIYFIFGWYTAIAPESVQDGMERLTDSFELIKGNIKYALHQSWNLWFLAAINYTMGNVKLFVHYFKEVSKIKIDSEALEDMKAFHYQMDKCCYAQLAIVKNDYELSKSSYNEVMSMAKLFPNAKEKYPSSMYRMWAEKSLIYGAAITGDWEAAESMLEKTFLTRTILADKYCVEKNNNA